MSGYRAPATLAELRDYVAGPDAGMQRKADGTVVVQVTHSNLTKTHFPEVRLDLHGTLGALKDKLYTHTGTQPANQQLVLQDASGHPKCPLVGDDRKLGFFSPVDGDIIHIQDLDPYSASARGWLEDTSLVAKVEMSEEEYAKRGNTVRQWKQQQMQQARQQQQQQQGPKAEGEGEDPTELMADLAAAIPVGARCEVFPGGRRATVRYVGKAEKLGPGWWVGVQYDDPVGKHDGAVKGVRFFECPAGFGGMARPDKVTVGNFLTLDEELMGEEAA